MALVAVFRLIQKILNFIQKRVYKKPTNSEFALPLFFYLQRIFKKKIEKFILILNGKFLSVNQINLKHL